MARVYYFLSETGRPVSHTDVAWHAVLPMNRHAARVPHDKKSRETWTNGDYFEAARAFLDRNGGALLGEAVSGRLKRSVCLEEIDEIHITLLKHGAFYHPARIRATGAFPPLCFVLNTAISPEGKQILRQEVEALKRLHVTETDALLPRVYAQASVPARIGNIQMFLGDWFIDFHEFHLSEKPAAGGYGIRVWNDTNGHYFLSDEQTDALYHGAALLLTAYYNPMTFDQIFPWHHGAGDFVVRVNGSDIDVRLITVRQYAPLFAAASPSPADAAPSEQVMFGLLIFLLNLTLRMRIDRLDGTGELVWAPETVLAPVWYGFLQGLAQGLFRHPWSADLVSAFTAYLSRIPVAAAYELALEAGGGFHADAEERALINANLIDHVAALWTQYIPQ